MSFSLILTYAFLIFISVSLALILLSTYIRNQQLLTYSEEIQQRIELNELNTKILIKSVYVSNNLVYVTVTNNGSTTFYDFKSFVVIVKYYANISNVSTLILSQYTYSTALAPYKWTSSAVVIPPDSNAVFTIDLPYPPYPNTKATIVISTNYGNEAIWRGIL